MVDLIDMGQLWTPAVYIGNAKNVYKLGSFGEESLSYLWYKFSPHMMHYSEIVTGKSFSENSFSENSFSAHITLGTLQMTSYVKVDLKYQKGIYEDYLGNLLSYSENLRDSRNL